MDKGIKRTIDLLGRITLPREIRKEFQIIDGETELAITVEDEAIVLRPAGKTSKDLKMAVDIIEREMQFARGANPVMAMGMLRIKELIEEELR